MLGRLFQSKIELKCKLLNLVQFNMVIFAIYNSKTSGLRPPGATISILRRTISYVLWRGGKQHYVTNSDSWTYNGSEVQALNFRKTRLFCWGGNVLSIVLSTLKLKTDILLLKFSRNEHKKFSILVIIFFYCTKKK